MLSQVLGGLGEGLGPGLFSSAYSSVGWSALNDQYGYDPAMAKILLNKEGFNESSTFRIDPSTRQTLRAMFIISRLSQPAEVAAADLFAKDMQAIGLPVVSLPISDLDFGLAMRTYSFDMFIDSQSANSAPTWLYNLFDSENNIAPVPLGTNLVGYVNSTFDNNVKELLTASNQDGIGNAAKKCQEILAADLPVLPVFSKDLLIAARSELSVTTIVGNMAETIRSTALSVVRNPNFSPPLRLGFTSDFDNLDPTTSSNRADWTALHLLTEPLLSVDQQGRLKPDLAQQWSISYDGTFTTITLRPDAKFYDGHSITAKDLVTTLNWLNKNVKPSSPLYAIIKGVTRADALDQNTLRIALFKPNKFAIDSFANLFALPESRLMNNPSTLDTVRSQLLVSSGPFVLREFTQADGVYMRLNNLYFGKPGQSLEDIEALEGQTIQGTAVSLGSEVKISSSPLVLDRQPVRNATYRICVYDQNDLATKCVAGEYAGNGIYSAVLGVDARFHPGVYKVESITYGTLPHGAFIISEQKTLTIFAVPLVPTLLVTVILAVAIAIRRRELAPSRRRRRIQRERSRKRTISRRRSR
jgi:ABC-type transport system substrate-binding protein